jgi:hypothetical protein
LAVLLLGNLLLSRGADELVNLDPLTLCVSLR